MLATVSPLATELPTWGPTAVIVPALRATIVVLAIVSAIALAVAVPVGLFAAIYMSEYASPRFRTFAKPAIEMLAAITDYFSARGMTSRYEAGYWRRLLVEVDDDRALTELEAQLAKPIRGPLDPFKHLFARMERRRRLRRLRQMDRQIVELEHVISFVDVPRARRRSQHLERLVSRAR